VNTTTRGPSRTTPRRTTLTRVAFSLYAILIAILTHKPGVAVPMVIPRTDLFVHLAVFSIWSGLFARSAFFGPWPSRRNLLISWAGAAAYAIIDESTQAIPALRRVAAVEDGLANVLGVTLGIALCALAARWLSAPTTRATADGPAA
jgi:hypothetical protein